jgi:Ras-related protein Rab-1A
MKPYIRDTAGQERFRSIISSYYRGVHSVLIVYDMTNERSLEDAITYWYDEVNRYCSTACAVPIVLVGNKADLLSGCDAGHRSRIMERANDFALTNNLAHIQTSARTGENVEAVFDSLTEKMLGERQRSSIAEQQCRGGSDSLNLRGGGGAVGSSGNAESGYLFLFSRFATVGNYLGGCLMS